MTIGYLIIRGVTFMHQDGKFEPYALAYCKPLKLVSHQGWGVVELFDSQYLTRSSVDDCITEEGNRKKKERFAFATSLW